MTTIVSLHLFPALAALLIGIAVLCLTKGTKLHMLLRGTWVILMGLIGAGTLAPDRTVHEFIFGLFR